MKIIKIGKDIQVKYSEPGGNPTELYLSGETAHELAKELVKVLCPSEAEKRWFMDQVYASMVSFDVPPVPVWPKGNQKKPKGVITRKILKRIDKRDK
jgi:hypothetical protein